MCSDGCARNRLYNRYIDGRDIEFVYLEEEYQMLVTKGIVLQNLLKDSLAQKCRFASVLL